MNPYADAMNALSNPTAPDHVADITAGDRTPKREVITPETNLAAYETAVAAVNEIAQTDAPIRPTRLTGSRMDPYGGKFPWGPIMETHQIGPYTILEYLDDRSAFSHAEDWVHHGRTLYHLFIDGKNTFVSALSLDAALAGAIAYRLDGPDSRAGDYFMRMVGGN